ncbi:hypothetical protein GLOTRDRAFT_118184 [Gloeophyllum trabeum ATCC 11539]|uniref:Uncharacterized protein n=1 Tax=Gloeophyllum trabeum (strain ATCC 11539 / FP-39264 / Madison 617) TaxID=670483 RepID=S7R8Z5_GLOTA|nr:uncharacterized protein GLOTRDRAFT_118184 [Gloeophyllum trabeum ATCC 11539]EPQ50780.1 hypothetical protein GLOTRDRAFT_118184 [Gloeophyllum trabeum ATCC 11539]
MDDKRSQTLQALSSFIERQRAVLARTQADIESLISLKRHVVSQPELDLGSLTEKFGGQLLSDQSAEASLLPDNVDWSLFRSCDPTPFRDLASSVRAIQTQRSSPSKTQQGPLSDLQKLVKETRRMIVDPVLSQLPPLSDDEDSPDEEVDQEELIKEREREKIRELKKRKISCGLTVPLRAHAVNGVFIRRDLEDESADVDISLAGDSEDSPAPFRMKEDPSADFAGLPTPVSMSESVDDKPRASRTSRLPKRRRIEEKAVEPSKVNGQRGSKPSKNARKQEDSPKPEPVATDASGRTSGKPKPETYKQAWSVSEQHLLERLLEEIPHGERNRWQKISQAMNGRRTPRQVASRVQKYFEKLKRFGIDPAGKGSTERE